MWQPSTWFILIRLLLRNPLYQQSKIPKRRNYKWPLSKVGPKLPQSHREHVRIGYTMSVSVMYSVWNKGGQCTGYYTAVRRIHYSLWSWNVIDRCLLFNPIASFSSVPIVTFFVLTPITRIIFDSCSRSLATLPFLLYPLKEVIVMVHWSYEIIWVSFCRAGKMAV